MDSATEHSDVYAKVLAVRKDIKALVHDATNPHASYTYVSIDKYYEAIIPLATKHGVAWRTRCTSWNVLPGQGKYKDRTWITAGFAVDVFTDKWVSRDYMTMSVSAPLEGAQSTGQVFSYAEKVFMRAAFGIPTGEKDADHTAPEEHRSSPQAVEQALVRTLPGHDAMTGEITLGDQMVRDRLSPDFAAPSTLAVSDLEQALQETGATTNLDGDPIIDARKVNEKSLAILERIFDLWLPEVKTRDRLLAWHTENVAAIEAAHRLDPAAGDRIRKKFKARLDTIDPPKPKPAERSIEDA